MHLIFGLPLAISYSLCISIFVINFMSEASSRATFSADMHAASHEVIIGAYSYAHV